VKRRLTARPLLFVLAVLGWTPFTMAQVAPARATKLQQSSTGSYALQTGVEEVVLSCTVLDKDKHLVAGLKQQDFVVTEDKSLRPIIAFKHEDVPVSMALLVDDSASMRNARESVNLAALDLVKASNPVDEALVIHFSTQVFLDQDFSSNIDRLRQGLQASALVSGGGTALYDAVITAGARVAKTATHRKQVLIIVTDGEDNASIHTLEEAVRHVQDLNGPTIYPIGLLFDRKSGEASRSKKILQTLADETGGVAFFPGSVGEVDAVATEVAREIRNQYTIAYRPQRLDAATSFRVIHVKVKVPGLTNLVVHTRKGYFPTRAE